MQRVVRLLAVLIVAAAAATNPAAAAAETTDSDTCWATGDINGNTIAFEMADWVYLTNFVAGGGLPPDPLYEGDLNADGFIDDCDVAFIWLVIINELNPELPILTVCNPDTIRGACFQKDTCATLSPENCAAASGWYAGNEEPCTCDCANHCDLNLDGSINPIDVAYIVAYVYNDNDVREQIPTCLDDNGDWNCDGGANPQDVVLYVNYVYHSTGESPCDPCAP